MTHKILVVDDEQTVCKMLRRFLESKKCSVVVAYNAEEALEAFKRERPDLVLLDVLMPGKDGLETLNELRALDPRVPVIMVTAVKDNEMGLEALKRGANGYVTKPIDPEFLWYMVDAKILMRTIEDKREPLPRE